MGEWTLRKPLVVAFYGTSLTTGRLSTRWVERLAFMFAAYPECVGPFSWQNMGKGSQNSDWGVANMATLTDLNPTHILAESFAINDSAVTGGVPAVSRANHLANMQTMHNAWKARNAAVDITWQTMNGVSAAGAALRPDLALYYGDDVTKAAAMGDRLLDNYAGALSPPGPAGGWPKPLPDVLTQDGDGLHPTQAATDTYLFPNTLYWLRLRAAEYWGLPVPVPPEPPPLPDAQYLIAAGAGGGGPLVYIDPDEEEGGEFYIGGGGGGAGGYKRGLTALSDLLGPVIIGQGAPAGDYINGTMSQAGPNVADGGGSGGTAGVGAPGASGGGAGGGAGPAFAGGAGDISQGNNGGGSAAGVYAAGGGGGKTGAGEASATSQGGPGVVNDVPGESGSVCAGGFGNNASALAYLAGAGPGNPGGGGRGARGTPSETVPDPGGDGKVWIWYPGAPRATGGTISTAGGATVHKFSFADMVRPDPMTGPALPAGLVASADSAFSGGFPAWSAFRNLRGRNLRAWASANVGYPHWLQQETAVGRRVTAYSFQGPPQSSEFIRTPYTWELRGSNNGFATYDVLDTRTAVVAVRTNPMRTFKVASPGTYTAYRMHVTAGQPGADAICEIASLMFWECPELQPL